MKQAINIRVGCGGYTRKFLNGFHLSGTHPNNELNYYSQQFNCVELRASFYRIFDAKAFEAWHERSDDEFIFYPLMPQIISHRNKLVDCDRYVDSFLNNASYLQEKLGTVLLQLPDKFGPAGKHLGDLAEFILNWPAAYPLAIECRHEDWFGDTVVYDELYSLLTQHNVTLSLIDTAGRRDLLHMRLSTPNVYLRFVGVNDDEIDHKRIDEWVLRLKEWMDKGLSQITIIIHQPDEADSPLLAKYLIQRINVELSHNLDVPAICHQSK